MIGLKMAWERYWQEIHSPNNRLVYWTQFILMVFLISLTLSSASIQRYLENNLQNLLGSDMVLSRYHALPEDQMTALRGFSNALSKTQLLNVTLTHKAQWQKAQLKLVDDQYPVQGELSVGYDQFGAHHAIKHGPKVGEIWLDSRLLTKLNLNIGQTLEVGEVSLTISAIIFYEPDRLLEGHSVALRALAHQRSFTANDMASSKRHFRYLVTANLQQQREIERWTQNTLPDAQLISRASGQHPLALFWQRVENFIGLAAVLLFFMAAIALDLASRRQLDSQKYTLALCMSMGMEMKQGLVIALGQWFLGFLMCLIPAVIFAYLAQWFIVGQLVGQFAGIQFGIHGVELVFVILLIFVLLLIFQLPGLYQLMKTSVLSLIRKQQKARFMAVRLGWNVFGLALLAAIYSDNFLLTALTLGAMMCSLLLMMAITFVVLNFGERISRGLSGLLPFTFFIMKQRLLSKSTQILGIGLCATLLLFTMMLMKDLGTSMEHQMRTQDGNLMITAAQSQHITAVKKWAKDTDSQIKQLRPYLRAQLIKVNDLELAMAAGKSSDSMEALLKPIRLSWSEEVPLNNQLSDGQWWQSKDQNGQQISVEGDVMTDIGLNIGDWLTFQIEGKPYDFKIVATHEFKGGNGFITFWFQVPPSANRGFESKISYMGSMELAPDAWPKLAKLWRQYPTLTLMPLKEITEWFDSMLSMVQKLVFGFSGMITLMALVVIVAAAQGFEQSDKKKNGLLLSMGLSKWGCLKLSLYEWFITALIAALGAIYGTWVAGVLIYNSQFSLTYQPDVIWMMVTLAVTSVVVCGVGLFYCRESLKTSVTQLMAE